MQTNETVKLYEAGSKETRANSVWQRVRSVCGDVAEVWRESRALEQRLLGETHYRRIGYE